MLYHGRHATFHNQHYNKIHVCAFGYVALRKIFNGYPTLLPKGGGVFKFKRKENYDESHKSGLTLFEFFFVVKLVK